MEIRRLSAAIASFSFPFAAVVVVVFLLLSYFLVFYGIDSLAGGFYWVSRGRDGANFEIFPLSSNGQ